MHKTIKQLGKYLGFFLLVYMLLFFLFSSSVVRKQSHHFFCNTHGNLLSLYFPIVNLLFRTTNETPPDWNTLVMEFYNIEAYNQQIAEAQRQGKQQISLNVKAQSYNLQVLFTPFFIFLISLILVTPIGWKSKLWSLLWGNLLFFIFLNLKMFIKLSKLISENRIGVYELHGFWENFYIRGDAMLKSGFTAMMVVLIWWAAIYSKKNIAEIKKQIGIND